MLETPDFRWNTKEEQPGPRYLIIIIIIIINRLFREQSVTYKVDGYTVTAEQ